MSPEMISELGTASSGRRPSPLRALVITGSGKAFCRRDSLVQNGPRRPIDCRPVRRGAGRCTRRSSTFAASPTGYLRVTDRRARSSPGHSPAISDRLPEAFLALRLRRSALPRRGLTYFLRLDGRPGAGNPAEDPTLPPAGAEEVLSRRFGPPRGCGKPVKGKTLARSAPLREYGEATGGEHRTASPSTCR